MIVMHERLFDDDVTVEEAEALVRAARPVRMAASKEEYLAALADDTDTRS